MKLAALLRARVAELEEENEQLRWAMRAMEEADKDIESGDYDRSRFRLLEGAGGIYVKTEEETLEIIRAAGRKATRETFESLVQQAIRKKPEELNKTERLLYDLAVNLMVDYYEYQMFTQLAFGVDVGAGTYE